MAWWTVVVAVSSGATGGPRRLQALPRPRRALALSQFHRPLKGQTALPLVVVVLVLLALLLVLLLVLLVVVVVVMLVLMVVYRL